MILTFVDWEWWPLHRLNEGRVRVDQALGVVRVSLPASKMQSCRL